MVKNVKTSLLAGVNVFLRCPLLRGLMQPWDLPRFYLGINICSPKRSCLSGCAWPWVGGPLRPSPLTGLQQVPVSFLSDPFVSPLV